MRASAWPLLLAAALFYLVLVQPNHPAALTWGALAVFPLELPVILLGLLALPPRRWAVWPRGALVCALVLIAVLKAADFAMFTALGRGFNPVSDLPLVAAGWNLATGSIGPVLAWAALLAAGGAVLLLGAGLWWASGVWAGVVVPGRVAAGLALGAVVSGAVAVAEIGQAMGRWSAPLPVPGAAFTARVGAERVTMARDTFAKLRRFRQAAQMDAFAGRTDLLARIDRDVLVLFVESYGRTSLHTPFYAATHRATLAEAEAQLTGLGLSMRSGILRAPTKGGQSWLSHASFANGLWVDNQTSYGAVLASNRRSLFHMAAESGFRTAAVMPQITMDWPEASRMGFDTVLAAKDLGYAGPAFNWVTMPDQFTLTALDRLLRNGADTRPLFAQVALVSSHAPWVPVPELVAWDDVGDGQIFAPMAAVGDPPAVVWRDHDRVRDQYRQAIDYALRSVFAYAARHAENPPLIFVVGDHQAAEFVALDSSNEVPVHVIGPPHLVQRSAAWGWQEGLLPDATITPLGMDAMRDLILDAYSHVNLRRADR